MKHQLIMESWRKYLREIDITDPDTARVITSPDPDLGNVKVSEEDFENLRTVIGLFDPTGISAYPDIPPAIEAFEKYRNIFAAANLAISLAAALPLLGKAGQALKGALKLKKASKSLKSSDALVRAPQNEVAEKIFYYVDQVDKVTDVVEKQTREAIRKSGSKVKDRQIYQRPPIGDEPTSLDKLSSLGKKKTQVDFPPLPSSMSDPLPSAPIKRVATPQMGLLDQAGKPSEWMTDSVAKELPKTVHERFLDAQNFVRQKVKERDANIGKDDTLDFIPDEIPKAYENPPRRSPKARDTLLSDDLIRVAIQDPRFLDALHVLIKYPKKQSPPTLGGIHGFLQKKLSIGFNRAARMVDVLKELGLVKTKIGGPNRERQIFQLNKDLLQTALEHIKTLKSR